MRINEDKEYNIPIAAYGMYAQWILAILIFFLSQNWNFSLKPLDYPILRLQSPSVKKKKSSNFPCMRNWVIGLKPQKVAWMTA